MGSRTEGMRVGCHWHGTSDLGEHINYFNVQLLSLKCLSLKCLSLKCLRKCQRVQGQQQQTCKA